MGEHRRGCPGGGSRSIGGLYRAAHVRRSRGRRELARRQRLRRRRRTWARSGGCTRCCCWSAQGSRCVHASSSYLLILDGKRCAKSLPEFWLLDSSWPQRNGTVRRKRTIPPL